MSRSTDPGHFFQTDASEATRARRAAKSGNKNGSPISLPSKILDVIIDPHNSSCIYVAESAACIRHVNVDSKDSKTIYRGPTAPLTSIAIGGAGGNMIFAGCWDKDIWSWDRSTKALGSKYKGHSDFVKTVLCARISGKDCLVSGSADKKIIVWDIATGTRLHTLRDRFDTMMAVQFLTIDPIDSTSDELIVVSSSSDPLIRRWRISLVSASQIDEDSSAANGDSAASREGIREHETSVYKLLFDGDEGDLWTASADGTARCLSRARNWATEEVIEHGDYVRAVAITSDWIITAGRDEDVKVWDRNAGKLYHVYDGHYEEITGLVVPPDGGKVISVSIDGTIRSWPLGKKELEKARSEREEKNKGIVKVAEPQVKESLLTEDEEAELAELMDDSE